MTSLLAWIAVDERRPTGLYFASDSRRSWKETTITRDNCTKLYLPNGTREIFGFAGDITFPSSVLQQICTEIEAHPDLVNGTEDPYQRYAWVSSRIETAFNALSVKPEYEFTILHGTRTGAMQYASFHLYQYTYDLQSNALASGPLSCEAGASVKVSVLGTGSVFVRSFVEKEIEKLGDVSRAHFSGFCESVERGDDKYSGGPIQLIGVHSIKNSLHYGVITRKARYFRGSPHLPANHANIRWRNWNFVNVDSHGQPIKKSIKNLRRNQLK